VKSVLKFAVEIIMHDFGSFTMITKLLDATKWKEIESLFCKKYDYQWQSDRNSSFAKLYIILKIYIVYASELSIMFDVYMDQIVTLTNYTSF